MQSVNQTVQMYSLIDYFLESGMHRLSMERFRKVLALNHCVFSDQKNVGNVDHWKAFRARERNFYRVFSAGIGDMIEWYSHYQSQTVWKQVAGQYLNMIGLP